MFVANKSRQRPASASPLQGWASLLNLQLRKTTTNSGAKVRKVRRTDLCFITHNLAVLVGNGLALPKALETIAQEGAMRKHADMLESLRHEVQIGETFSNALSKYPATFNEVIVNQVRAGERAGTLANTLTRIAAQLEKADEIRRQAIRKLAYPAILVVAGALSVTFMLLFVVPVFEDIYAESKVPLPGITRALIAMGNWMVSYGWIALLAVVAAVLSIRRARTRPEVAARMDQVALRLPILGDWIRYLAVLQFMDVFGDLLEAGFKVVDALDLSSRSIGNRAIRRTVCDLQAAVTRGERLGRELERTQGIFPPVVSQLIAVGERTGKLPRATAEIRRNLAQETIRRTNLLVGTLEPVLTISLAATIAIILLAIYLPMFDMIGAVGGA